MVETRLPGWLALQPHCHRTSSGHPDADELRRLGPDIKVLDQALSECWKPDYPDDPDMRHRATLHVAEVGVE